MRIETHGLGLDFAPLAQALARAGCAPVRLDPGASSAASAAPALGWLMVAGATVHWQSRDEAAARTRALLAGADDVIGPWMDRDEAVARILRLARRPDGRSRITCGDLVIRLVERGVERAGRPIRLLGREYELLLHLARCACRPVPRVALLKAVWRLDFDPGTNSVEVHMSRLRAKVDRGFPTRIIHTIRGEGYMLAGAPPRQAATGTANLSR